MNIMDKVREVENKYGVSLEELSYDIWSDMYLYVVFNTSQAFYNMQVYIELRELFTKLKNAGRLKEYISITRNELFKEIATKVLKYDVDIEVLENTDDYIIFTDSIDMVGEK